MNFIENLTYSQLAKLAGCSPEALKQRVYRNKVTKAQALAECTGVDQVTLESVTSVEQLEKIFNKEIQMDRKFSNRPFSSSRVTTVQKEKEPVPVVDEEPRYVTRFDLMEEQTASKQDTTTQHNVHVTQEEALRQPAQRVVTFIKSDILAVTCMLVLSVLIAVSFTAKIFIASGVTALPAYIMSVLLDFTMIVFVFRGHTSIAWLFGVNIFFQVALTTSAKMFVNWMPESTIIGIKGLLVAISIVIAIKGLSDYVQKNFK